MIIQNVAIPILSCILRSPQLRGVHASLQSNFEGVFRGVYAPSHGFTHSLITLYCEYLLLIASAFPQSGLFSKRIYFFEMIEHSDRMGSFVYSQIVQLMKIQDSPDVDSVLRSIRVIGSAFSGMTHAIKYYITRLGEGKSASIYSATVIARLPQDQLRSLNVEILSHFKTDPLEVRLFIIYLINMLPQHFLFLSSSIVRDIVSVGIHKANEGDISSFTQCVSVAVALLALDGLQQPTQAGYDPLVKNVLDTCLKYVLFVYQMFRDQKNRDSCYSIISLLASLFPVSLLATVSVSILQDLNANPQPPVYKVMLFHFFYLATKDSSQLYSLSPEEVQLFQAGFTDLLSTLQDDLTFCVVYEFVSCTCRAMLLAVGIQNNASFDTVITRCAEECLKYFVGQIESTNTPSLAYHYLTLMSRCPWSRLDISLFDMVVKLLPYAWKTYKAERTILREGPADTVQTILAFSSFS